MSNAWATSLGPLIDHKLYELGKLGAASKQLSKVKKNKKTIRRCHIAMASIVSDMRHVHGAIIKIHPELKGLFDSLLLLYADCKNGNAEQYIHKG